MNQSLDTALRTLLLPLRPGTGAEYAQRAEAILTDIGVREDLADWVCLESNSWEATGNATKEFKDFVSRLLFSEDLTPKTFAIDVSEIEIGAEPDGIIASFASKYFDLHARVVKDEKVDHQQAKRVLSHTHTMVLLATGGKMTASRIYSMLLTDGIALGKSWSTTRSILDACGVKQEVSANEVEAVYNLDAEAEAELLGDQTIEESLEFVGETCSQMGYEGDIQGQLQMLFGPEQHPPYLCMLHFQLTTLAYYNHRLTNGYEFSPRGEGVLWLTKNYNEAGVNVGRSPFLNNAKSVDTLDANWASAKKKKERNTARALVDILAELDCLSDPSRAAAGKYLRSLLHRTLRISQQEHKDLNSPIPEINTERINQLIRGVAKGNTGTRGVIEQRLVDAVALIEAGDLTLWKTRGFGDSVFTTNTSQKKLGDVELKHTDETSIVALEAHGGRLTEKYVQDHLSSLSNVLPLRAAELEDRAPLAEWTVELQFIAHELDEGMTTSIEVEGVQINISYRKFDEIIHLEIAQPCHHIFDKWFREALNTVYVHPDIRKVACSLMAG